MSLVEMLAKNIVDRKRAKTWHPPTVKEVIEVLTEFPQELPVWLLFKPTEFEKKEMMDMETVFLGKVRTIKRHRIGDGGNEILIIG